MAVLLTLFLVLLCSIDHGIFDDGYVDVSVMEGDPVTLHTDALTQQHEDIKWYFNDRRIAEISGDLSEICTDVQCVDGDERFRDRLKLDHQTGSLTVQNTRTTDSGLYELKLISSRIREKTFNVTVSSVPAIEPDKKSVKEGESLILDPDEIRNPNDVMMWYFNDILIAEITGDQSKICEEDRCKERFRDRLEVNYKTGSLTISNIRDSDSGEYKLKINSTSLRHFNRPISVKGFTVAVTVPESGQSSAAVAGICAAVVVVLLLVAAAAVIYYRKRQAGQNDGSTQNRDQVDQELSCL